jgi:UDP-N-acetylmuramoyl-tripeptide--D-alanyl-D-alanine ligase
MHSQIKKIHSWLAQGAKVSTDSRNIEKGCIFFALRGEKFDANDFALQAIEKGAAIAVVDRKELPQNDRFIFVDDTLKALQDLAEYHRELFNIPVLGITGSNGKTTTKELVNAVLSSRFRTLCTSGNLNNHIGVPLTLLNLNDTHEMAIIEMGANHMGEIGFLSSLAKPTIGLITNIGKAHIEGFGSFENIIKGKTELYDFIRNSGGTILLNADNHILSEKSTGIRAITYGKGDDAFVHGSVISSQPFLQIQFHSSEHPGPLNINSQLLGVYNFENIMSAVAAGLYSGVPAEEICKAIEAYSPVNSRSQLKKTAGNTLILDSYNANPTSLRAAIENFSALETDQPKGLIIGDMLEMGDTAEQEHAEIIRLTRNFPYSFVILVGEHFCKANPSLPSYYAFADSESAAEWVKNKNLSGYTILLKGSRGIQLEKIEKYL